MPILRKLLNSLQFQLIIWSVLSLLLLAIVAGGYGFWYSYNEINDFQDDNLKNTAALLEQSLNIGGANHTVSSDSQTSTRTNIHFDTDDDDGAITVDILIRAALPTPLSDTHQDHKYHDDDSDDDSKPIPITLLSTIPLGISDQDIDGHKWRTYRDDVQINALDISEKVVLILRQQTDLQDDLAKASALQSSLPLIIGIALLILLLPFVMWRMMQPVRQLHHEISTRNENDLSPLQIEKLPSELLPLAESLNWLLALVKSSIERQQRFIADAAHELRSPLTAISLQLQRLQRMNNDEHMSEGLDKLALRLKRNQSLVEQLLTLAQSGNIPKALDEQTSTDIKLIIEQVIGLLIPIVDNKNIELIVDLQPTNKVKVEETSLLVLIKNLIQNAIIYTPANRQVTIKLYELKSISDHWNNLSLEAQYNFGTPVIHANKINRSSKLSNNRVIVQIIDSGTGIYPSEYKRAFDPFVRLNQRPQSTDHSSGENHQSDTFGSDNIRSDNASKDPYDIPGTGLGLSIVKSICEQSNITVFMKDATSMNAGMSDQNNNQGLCITLVF